MKIIMVIIVTVWIIVSMFNMFNMIILKIMILCTLRDERTESNLSPRLVRALWRIRYGQIRLPTVGVANGRV